MLRSAYLFMSRFDGACPEQAGCNSGSGGFVFAGLDKLSRHDCESSVSFPNHRPPSQTVHLVRCLYSEFRGCCSGGTSVVGRNSPESISARTLARRSGSVHSLFLSVTKTCTFDSLLLQARRYCNTTATATKSLIFVAIRLGVNC